MNETKHTPGPCNWLLTSEDGSYALRINPNEIWFGVPAEQTARRLLASGNARLPNFVREQLARSPASRRSSKWKDGMRMALTPLPLRFERKADFIARARRKLAEGGDDK